jgi:hypothetical protein
VSRRRPVLAEPFDSDDTLHVLRDNLGRADTMVTAADDLIVQMWSDDDEEERLRRRNHISYLMEAARFAVRAALHAGNQLHQHRRGT